MGVNGVEGFNGTSLDRKPAIGNPLIYKSKCIEIRYDPRSLEIIDAGDRPPVHSVGRSWSEKTTKTSCRKMTQA